MIPRWLLLFLLAHNTDEEVEYSYDDIDEWPENFPLCGGKLQSPISLSAPTVIKAPPPILSFPQGIQDTLVELVHTGTVVKLYFRPQRLGDPFLQLTTVLGVFRFAQLLLHWGDGVNPGGSEHAIRGNFGSAEAHFVFYNKKYGDFEMAVGRPNGILVMGVLLNPTQQKMMFPPLGLDEQLPEVTLPGGIIKYETDLMAVQSIMEYILSDYYTYKGSLTMPPCNTVVRWVVAAKMAGIDPDIFDQLVSTIYVDDAMERLLVNNFRPLQNQEGRTIKRFRSVR